MIATIIRFLVVFGRLQSAHPMDPSRAAAHVSAAMSVETADLPAELLLGMAYVESDYDPTYTSRLEDGVRVTGRWPSRSPAGKGNRLCGPLQTEAKASWKRCLEQRELAEGYRKGVEEMTEKLGRARGDLRRALRTYGCGNAGAHGACRRYDLRVLTQATALGFAPPTPPERKVSASTQLRVLLVMMLSPESRCSRCSESNRPEHLIIDHVDGRTWVINKLGSLARVRRYFVEFYAGVRLRAVCSCCSQIDAGRRYPGIDRAALT